MNTITTQTLHESATVAEPPVLSWAASLIDVLERQQSLVSDLAALSQSQADLIAEGRGDRLLELLARRQALIDEFNVCQSHMMVLSRELSKRVGDIDPAQRRRIGELVGCIGDGLKAVMEQDQRDQVALQAGRTEVLKELTTLDAASKARGAYATPVSAATDSRFADRTG